MQKIFSTISLFSGCGGLDLGFRGDFDFLGKNIQKEILKLLGQMILTRPLAQLLENILNMK